MQNSLKVNGIWCETVLIDDFIYVIVGGEQKAVYCKTVKHTGNPSGKCSFNLLKGICQECGKEFLGRLDSPRKYCGGSCSSKATIKNTALKNLHSVNVPRHIKQKARDFIGDRVKAKKIIPPLICSNCDRFPERIEAHHLDYYKVNEVWWLCVSCHRKLHRGHDIKGELIVYDL